MGPPPRRAPSGARAPSPAPEPVQTNAGPPQPPRPLPQNRAANFPDRHLQFVTSQMQSAEIEALPPTPTSSSSFLSCGGEGGEDNNSESGHVSAASTPMTRTRPSGRLNYGPRLSSGEALDPAAAEAVASMTDQLKMEVKRRSMTRRRSSIGPESAPPPAESSDEEPTTTEWMTAEFRRQSLTPVGERGETPFRDRLQPGHRTTSSPKSSPSCQRRLPA